MRHEDARRFHLNRSTMTTSNLSQSNRRSFLKSSLTLAACAGMNPADVFAKQEEMDTAYFQHHRKFLNVDQGRIAYVEKGRGPVALFLHGFPLNGYQWRGALERLNKLRRCIAPDLMGMGYSEIQESVTINPDTQVDMLVSFLDRLSIRDVDLVANDSGGLVAQIFIARIPGRIKSLLISNCDVDENNPPKQFLPAVSLAKKHLFAEKYIAPQLGNLQVARSARGIGASYTYPDRLAEATIEYYFCPLVSSPARIAQLDSYTVSMGVNLLVPLRESLQQWAGPVRILWGAKDTFFGVEWAQWLNHNLRNSKDVRSLDNANLFFPEEMPEVIAEEAEALWRI